MISVIVYFLLSWFLKLSIHTWTLCSIIYCSVLFACWTAYHSGQGLIGRHVRVQHEWNGPLVSSMAWERFFNLIVFPLLGTKKDLQWPGLSPVYGVESLYCSPVHWDLDTHSLLGCHKTWGMESPGKEPPILSTSENTSFWAVQTCINQTSNSIVKHIYDQINRLYIKPVKTARHPWSIHQTQRSCATLRVNSTVVHCL